MALYSRASSNIMLQEALDQCREILSSGATVALLYTPSWCGFAEIGPTAKDWHAPSKPGAFNLDSVFEARIFSEHAELRWLQQWPNDGRAVLISETEASNYLAEDAGLCGREKYLDRTYLLWGEGIEPKDLRSGWSRLAMARIGTMDVPYPDVNKKGERIHLVAREYLDVIDDYGNVAVVEERLLRLERA